MTTTTPEQYRDKTEPTRIIELVGRCSAREMYSTPVAWEAKVVSYDARPNSVGRAVFINDRTLRSRYSRIV